MEKDKYKIRQARIDDAVRVRELLKTWLPESPYNFGNVNNKKFRFQTHATRKALESV